VVPPAEGGGVAGDRSTLLVLWSPGPLLNITMTGTLRVRVPEYQSTDSAGWYSEPIGPCAASGSGIGEIKRVRARS
jgi:hypothetical protein